MVERDCDGWGKVREMKAKTNQIVQISEMNVKMEERQTQFEDFLINDQSHSDRSVGCSPSFLLSAHLKSSKSAKILTRIRNKMEIYFRFKLNILKFNKPTSSNGHGIQRGRRRTDHFRLRIWCTAIPPKVFRVADSPPQ